MLRRIALGVPVLLALAVGGCGSSLTTSSSQSSPAASMMPSARTTTAGVLRTSPEPLPAGTPAAPAGLARTGGYGTYELCRGTCTGAIPAALRRPLRLPAAHVAGCPVTTGAEMITASNDSADARTFLGSRWLALQVTWRAAPGYRGPLLIRGRQLGAGGGAVGFGEGHRPYDELQLMDTGRQARTGGRGDRAWLSLTRVRRPGCYAYQVDGTSFSRVIVFRVRAPSRAA